ncbi:hypothetical protein GQ457_14G025710 [Hibiscus cannabinus]
MEVSISFSSVYVDSSVYVEVVFLLACIDLLGLATGAPVVRGNDTDQRALLQFKAKITGDRLGVMESWNSSIHFWSSEKLLVEFKKQMESVFEMSDLNEMTYFLEMEVQQSQQGTFISQQGFSLKILKKFCMENCKFVTTPIAHGEKLSSKDDFERVNEKSYRSLIGCLLYLTATRPDIMFDVSLLSRFIHCCNVSHFKAAKRVSRYIKGTSDYGVWFKKVEKLSFIGSKKQDTVAQSTTEAEYIADAGAVNQAIWLRKLLSDLNLMQDEAIEIYCDNQSAVAIAKYPVFHGKTKHFKIKFHFVRKVEQNNEITLVHCSSENQLADILTKPRGKIRFEDLRMQIGVRSKVAKEEC